ncbi:uncharacterized protein GlcG (DUF336 family) [Nitrosomonas nitrosa]|jgi:uncharacterized protein GlcG (DUF336 family)|uniref:Uncharacterized conserved protein GlcG, DUF336 family n=1 Tax=Nitrosomonas nitrosa TaxID=52442 RepID=A0A1I4MD69_9PROT|nr:heme-binding protein [Nitrosomonas nitrosa]PTQ94773.1 uncharacterized protein GlcG (DUF336 family) [Nitrosomonas nitrosa]CAE6517719.1 conserved exported hypothetical protein [Nitrosomonas nitrosa]SFM01023.1 Uncharacterized conserved protein GlcG, DUF336 family [Nitrosomonas nitrosa]
MRLALFMFLVFISLAAQANTRLTYSQANEIVMAAAKQCERDGYNVSVAVVDQSGVIRSQIRMDHAGAHTIESSFRKAYTSASLKLPTMRLAKIASSDPELHGLHHMADNILMLGGGLPIVIEGEVVGGIGVGGAPGTRLDEICAEAGLKILQEKK